MGTPTSFTYPCGGRLCVDTFYDIYDNGGGGCGLFCDIVKIVSPVEEIKGCVKHPSLWHCAVAVASVTPAKGPLKAERLVKGVRDAKRARRASKAKEILPKPIVNDAELQNYVNDLYKGTTNPNRVGTGTTADAVREEVATGQATAGKFHIQKAEDTARGLGNWLRRNPGADPHDRLVARSLRDELLDALGRGR